MRNSHGSLSLVPVGSRKDVNYVSCRRDITEAMFEAVLINQLINVCQSVRQSVSQSVSQSIKHVIQILRAPRLTAQRLLENAVAPMGKKAMYSNSQSVKADLLSFQSHLFCHLQIHQNWTCLKCCL